MSGRGHYSVQKRLRVRVQKLPSRSKPTNRRRGMPGFRCAGLICFPRRRHPHTHHSGGCFEQQNFQSDQLRTCGCNKQCCGCSSRNADPRLHGIQKSGYVSIQFAGSWRNLARHWPKTVMDEDVPRCPKLPSMPLAIGSCGPQRPINRHVHTTQATRERGAAP